jgi:hypothetical protein
MFCNCTFVSIPLGVLVKDITSELLQERKDDRHHFKNISICLTDL